MTKKLYIIMRSDMDSHTTGKKMAQASHASNAFVKHAFEAKCDISEWVNQTPQGFGTVYVLDGGSMLNIKRAVDPLIDIGCVAGYVNDPTYPVLDGAVLHQINIETCAYVYSDEIYEVYIKNYLKDFELHP